MPKRTRFVRTARDLHELDPTLRPDWRYQRALELVSHKPRPRWCAVKDDAVVRAMVSLLQNRVENGRGELAADLAGPMDALAIYERPDQEFRIRLECEILAGQSDEQIAETIGITTACVASFEGVFFNVRERLNCSDWICARAMNGRDATAIHRELRAIAYFLGPAALHGPLGSDPSDYWQANKLIAEFMTSLKQEFTPLQVLELHRVIATERHANKSIAAFNATVTDAARQLMAATCPNAGDQKPTNAERVTLRQVA